MKNIFTHHPNSVGESYLQHFFTAFSFFLLLFSLSLKALIHGIFPFLYEKSVSKRIKLLSDEMQARNKNIKD